MAILELGILGDITKLPHRFLRVPIMRLAPKIQDDGLCGVQAVVDVALRDFGPTVLGCRLAKGHDEAHYYTFAPDVVYMTVHAPRVGQIERLAKEMPEPKAPAKKGVVKVGQIEELNYEDPGYKEQCRRRRLAFQVAGLLECCRQIKGIKAKREDQPAGLDGTLDYYRKVRIELEEIGLDVGIVDTLSTAAVMLNEVDQAELLEGRAVIQDLPPSS